MELVRAALRGAALSVLYLVAIVGFAAWLVGDW